MESELLRDFLRSVVENGAATVSKRRLLWWTGRRNDTPSVWAKILQEFEDVGGDQESLHGVETSGMLTFVVGSVEPVKNWAR